MQVTSETRTKHACQTGAGILMIAKMILNEQTGAALMKILQFGNNLKYVSGNCDFAESRETVCLQTTSVFQTVFPFLQHLEMCCACVTIREIQLFVF